MVAENDVQNLGATTVLRKEQAEIQTSVEHMVVENSVHMMDVQRMLLYLVKLQTNAKHMVAEQHALSLDVKTMLEEVQTDVLHMVVGKGVIRQIVKVVR